MSVERVNPPPVGLTAVVDAELPTGSAVSIEPTEDGGVEIEFGPEESEDDEAPAGPQGEHDENLVGYLDPEDLVLLSDEVYNGWKADRDSRAEWDKTFDTGLKLLGIKLEETNKPFRGAANAVHPLIIENCVKFQAKSSIELLPPGGPVRARVRGIVTEQKQQKATRVAEYMNFQLTEEIADYYDEQERLLFFLPVFGSAFKKIYYDERTKQPCAQMIPADQLVVGWNVSHLKTADRYTHEIIKSKQQLERDEAAGLYEDVDGLQQATQVSPSPIQEATNKLLGVKPSGDEYSFGYRLLEQHLYYRMPWDSEDEPAPPYVVTIEEISKQVLGIRRLWDEDDESKAKRIDFIHYRFVPGLGFYGLGYVHLLGNLTLAATMSMRTLLDAGQFASLPGGFKLKTFRLVGGNKQAEPGEWLDIDYMGKIGDAIMPHPYKEPSQTLLAMFDKTVGAGQKFADTTDQVISESTNYGPVGTTMALLEASTKFYSAIHKRLHRAQGEEFRVLKRLNGQMLPEEYPYDVVGGSRTIYAADFDDEVDVTPVSDPNVPSAAHKVALGQLVASQAAQAPPGTFDTRAVNRYLLNAAGIQELDSLMPPPEQAQARDPISDVVAATQGKPVVAAPGQDHMAYIGVFSAFISDPSVQSNQMMAPAMQILGAAIRDHQVQMYLEQMAGLMQANQEQAMGATMEQLAAASAQQILQANMMAAQQAQGGDPMQQMAQAEMLKAQAATKKVDLDAAAKAADASLKARALDIDAERVKIQAAQTMGTLQNARRAQDLNASVKMATQTVANLAKAAQPKQESRPNAQQKR
jgi:hypothetical protein